MAIDETKLNQLLGQMLADLGGAVSVAMVRMGDALGLYKILHGQPTVPQDGIVGWTLAIAL